ncbi:hypothetical protein pthi1_p15 [Paracoccus phage vB_PthS_Pthi1]|nr:hypothetical protein pthi1_p15 [Paracoccus phage vB_PthS_Pthi1]
MSFGLSGCPGRGRQPGRSTWSTRHDSGRLGRD